LAKLRMKVKKLIGSRSLAIHLNGGVDDVKPGHGHRLVVAAGWQVRNMVGSIVCPDASTQLPGGNGMTKAHRIKIGQLHMRAMMPLVEWKGATLELLDENIIVAHKCEPESEPRLGGLSWFMESGIIVDIRLVQHHLDKDGRIIGSGFDRRFRGTGMGGKMKKTGIKPGKKDGCFQGRQPIADSR